MPDPFKLKALKAVTAALKEITPANGYVNDLADFDPGDGVMTSRVYRGRLWFGESDPIPMLSLLEGQDPAEDVAPPPVNTPSAEYDWDLIVQGFVDDDPANPTDPAYTLLADVRKRLLAERKIRTAQHDPNPFGLGLGKNRVVDVRVGPGVVRPADDVSAKAWFWLRLTLRIFDNAENPYD
jgi:hypothetical protein